MNEPAICELCGEPMPLGEGMFKFHGYSGPCPKPPLPKVKLKAPMVQFVELAQSYKLATPGPYADAALAALCACVEWMVAHAAQFGITREEYDVLAARHRAKETNVIKPTVGRVVLFHPHPEEHIHTGNPQAAIVCQVHNDHLVTLSVFDENGKQYPARSVRLWQGDTPRPEGYYCEWMEYQLGQAARTAQAEARGGSQAASPGLPQNKGSVGAGPDGPQAA